MSATEHETLLEALLAVQSETPALQKSKINPAFKSKYVSLDTLMETVMPILNAHGLVWLTLPCRDEAGPALTYRLVHATSGEAVEGTMPLMLAKTDPQGQGSAITYSRRYSLMAVLGLVADEDDDGNKASKRQEASGRANGNGSPEVLPPARVAEVVAAIKRAKMPLDWARMQLVAVGAPEVPDGPILTATLQALTPEQATELIGICDEAANR